MSRLVKIERSILRHRVNSWGFRIHSRRPPKILRMGKGATCRSAFRATAILTAKGRLLRDSIHLRRIFPIRRPSPCFRRAISSGASRREGWDYRSKVCPGNRPCRDGNTNCRMKIFGRSSWVSTTGRIRSRGLGSSVLAAQMSRFLCWQSTHNQNVLARCAQ